jgi:hypothetical protein
VVEPNERPPRYAPVVTYEQWRQQQRAEKRARALEVREQRMALRTDRPWRLRLGGFVTGSPRSINGFGAYDEDERYAYAGLGVDVHASRWLSSRFRLDMRVAIAKVFGDYYTSGPHGAEGAAGAAITVHNRGRVRIGGGVGADAVLARELDEAVGSHFGWLGARLFLVGEIGFVSRNDYGVVVRLSPTFTYAPYASGLAPGVIFGAGFDLPL